MCVKKVSGVYFDFMLTLSKESRKGITCFRGKYLILNLESIGFDTIELWSHVSVPDMPIQFTLLLLILAKNFFPALARAKNPPGYGIL